MATADPRPGTCLLCGAPLRRWCTKHGRPLVRCPRCGLIRVVAPAGEGEGAPSVYQGEDAVFLRDGNEAYYLDETNFGICRRRLEWVAQHAPPPGRLLDAGAGFGHFLSVAQGSYEAEGFDLSPLAVAWSQEHLHVANRVATVDDLPEDRRGPYDVVTAWDLLEHLTDPLAAVESLRGVLRPHGWLFVSTPDAGSRVARLLGRRWYYLDPVQHLTLFTRANLARALERAGFQVADTRTFGRDYRVRYVFDRLLQVYRNRLLRGAVRAARTLLGFAANRTVYLRLGDVMGLAAQRQG